MNIPYYILGAIPHEKCKIKGIFESKKSSIMELLSNPENLRWGGWDLKTHDSPRIVRGEYLEIGSGWKLIHLFEDGTLILRVRADHESLGWPRGEKEFKERPRINPLGLIEITLNFVIFYKTIINNFDREVKGIKFQIEFKNIFLDNNKKLYLTPFHIGSHAWMFENGKKFAPSNNMKKEINIEIEQIKGKHQYVTYKIIKQIYLWFGLTEEEIPYSYKDKNNEKYIDPGNFVK